MAVTTLPDLKVLPAEALRALILAQHQELITKDEQLLSREREIEHLKLLLVKLHRMQFGGSRRSYSDRSSSWSCGWKNWNRIAMRKQALPRRRRWQLP
jgi:hypothetical protein